MTQTRSVTVLHIKPNSGPHRPRQNIQPPKLFGQGSLFDNKDQKRPNRSKLMIRLELEEYIVRHVDLPYTPLC